MVAYGYIRKSVVHDAARMLSPEMQEAAIRKLAAYYGDDEIVILSDLDRSGKLDRTRRPGWDQVLTAIESGEAHAIYAYSLSRFARSLAQLTELRLLCERTGTAFRSVKEHLDTTSPTGKLYFGFQAVLEEFWSDVTSERVKDAFVIKRANDPTWTGPGNKPYGSLEGEDPMVVVAAFREAGSFDGAARILNGCMLVSNGYDADDCLKDHEHRLRVPSRFSNRHMWSGSVVRGVVKNHAPDEVGPFIPRGSKAGRQSFRFAQLIECSTCHKTLTGSRDTRRGDVRYACSRARVIPHVRGWVNESKLMPVIKAEVKRAALAIKRLQVGSAEDEAAIAALEAERDRVKTLFRKGHMGEAELDAAMVEIADAESKLDTRRWIRRASLPPDIDTGDPASVSAYLRRLFERVIVDMSQPASFGPSKWLPTLDFVWRDPSLRIAQFEYITDEELSDGYAEPIQVGTDHIDFEDRAIG